jgi:hypothetical protein
VTAAGPAVMLACNALMAERGSYAVPRCVGSPALKPPTSALPPFASHSQPPARQLVPQLPFEESCNFQASQPAIRRQLLPLTAAMYVQARAAFPALALAKEPDALALACHASRSQRGLRGPT